MAKNYEDAYKFGNAKRHAKERGVEWKLTFNEWLNWWQETGHYHERGPLANQYCMARYGDIGPYSLDNIKCITNSENVKEARTHTKYPSGGEKNNAIGCICEGIYYSSIKDASIKYGVTYQAISYRLNSKKFKDFIRE